MSQRQLSVTVYKEKECLEDQRLQWEWNRPLGIIFTIDGDYH
jgi:hypothetical protein